MFKIAVFALTLTVLFHSTSQANVEIKDQAIVVDLVTVQNEIDSISSSIMSCMDSGKEHKDCMCDNEIKFINFKKTVKVLFEKHPDLNQHDLIHYRTPDGMINNQSLVGIKKQANVNFSCE